MLERMAVGAVDPEIERLLRVAIESVTRLEILLLMRREQTKTFTTKELRSRLSIGGAAADMHLAILCGRGLLGVTIGHDLVYAYGPISKKIDHQVAEIAHLWETRRTDVEAIIGKERSTTTAASAVADPLRSRKNGGRDG